jgi:tartrate dehydratase beta subunit/fumarate hydratase class I family protein
MFPLPCSPRATLRRTRYTAWTSAPTTTSPSPSTPASFWRGAQKEVELIAYEDLGAEAIRRLTVEEFPVTVVNDLYGGDLYREGRERWRRRASDTP